MHTDQPYSSARLSHGTLLMTHPPSVVHRYDYLHRLIRIESLGIALAGAFAASVGLIAQELAIMVLGMAVLLSGMLSWPIRHMRLRYRQRWTPTMIFISEEGVTGMFPDTSSVLLRWERLKAREIYYQHRNTLSRNETDGSRGVMLRADARRFYLTSGLNGFSELRDILKDFGITLLPVPTTSATLRGGITKWNLRAKRQTPPEQK